MEPVALHYYSAPLFAESERHHVMDEAQRRQQLFGTTAHRRTVASSSNASSTGGDPSSSTGTHGLPASSHGGMGAGAPGVGAGAGCLAAASEREMIERQNDEKVDRLRGHVGEMRHLAIDIGQEVREHNAMLDGMSTSFDRAGDSVRQTIDHVRKLAGSGGGLHMCALLLFAFVFFLLVYLLVR